MLRFRYTLAPLLLTLSCQSTQPRPVSVPAAPTAPRVSGPSASEDGEPSSVAALPANRPAADASRPSSPPPSDAVASAAAPDPGAGSTPPPAASTAPAAPTSEELALPNTPVAQPTASVTPAPAPLDEPEAIDTPEPTGSGPCATSEERLSEVLGPIVEGVVAEAIPYPTRGELVSKRREWRDCSGIFLRVSSHLAQACPAEQGRLAAPPGVGAYGPGVEVPISGQEKARGSRGLAKWFHRQGRFTPIYYDDAPNPSDVSASLKKVRNKIKVGTVLWFSRGAPTQEGGVMALFSEDHQEKNRIDHIALVTGVTRDRKGNVTKLAIVHGRSAGKDAAVTKKHFWEWPEYYRGRDQYPPFGNWTQRLVGIADIL